MRPEILFPLFAPLDTLPHIGQKTAKLIAELTGEHIIDLCWHMPSNLIDRSFRPPVAALEHGKLATLYLTIDRHLPPPAIRRRLPYRVLCHDATGKIHLVFFHARAPWLQQLLPEGEWRYVSGTVEFFKDKPQIVHPDHILTEEEMEAMPEIEPVYRKSAGLSSRIIGQHIRAALEKTPALPEWHDAEHMAKHSWPSWKDALVIAHNPQNKEDMLLSAPARQRLAADEFLANQLALGLMREALQRLPGRSFPIAAAARKKVLAALPFRLTASQLEALAGIDRDMAAPQRMLRLLQGDVGSGKTIVAFLAALNALASGAQAAFMAPTEILARQHGERLASLCAQAGISMHVLTGSEKKASRSAILAALADGSCQLLVGTHSLFQKDVAFRDLGFVVIDEQQRFGVEQRTALSGKGTGVDILIMTATPIPRTLMLASYGDAHVSRIVGKPPGRKPIATRVLPFERLEEVTEAVARVCRSGGRAYWVCPLVEESEKHGNPLTDAISRYEYLQNYLGGKTGLVHGRMAHEEREPVLRAFREGKINILVATTVIEVGVDVPEATIMVIEHAERFGLAQLHQLRGRIGRSARPSSCLLLYQPPLTENARQRLQVMRSTEDGFLIAEEDRRLRGSGEILGTRQSGLPAFRLADPFQHSELLAAAREEADQILREDPELRGVRGEALRILLYLFERDEAVSYLRSG